MARDGSGNYTRPISAFVTGTTIDSSDFNDCFDDMEDALSDSINKAGTKAFAANQPMGGFKFTGLGAGSASGESVRYEQISGLLTAGVSDPTLVALAGVTIASGKLIKGTGTDTFTTIDITSSAEALLAGTLSDFTLTGTDAGNNGPTLTLYHNSASPAASDTIGVYQFQGKDSAGNLTTYANVSAEIVDATNGSEDARLVFRAMTAAGSVGLPQVMMYAGAGLYSPNASGGDKGADTLNFSTLYQAGIALPTWSAQHVFSAAQTISIAGDTPLTLTCTDAGAAAGPIIDLYRNSASPASLDAMGRVTFNGKDSGGNKTEYANIEGVITDATDGSEDSAVVFRTVVAGTLAARGQFAGGFYHPSATGGDKGNNSINYGAVYDDNTLLTCFVLEYANTGAVDLSFWDGIAPTGRHEGAHRFYEQRHLLDLDAYIDHWKTHGHLPGLPSRDEWADHGRDKKPIGDMISRLWQTVEMQAVHISFLNDRLTALEQK